MKTKILFLVSFIVVILLLSLNSSPKAQIVIAPQPYITSSGAVGVILGTNGLVGAPSYSWASETNSGWYRSGSGDFRFSIAGIDVFKMAGVNISNLSTNGTFNVPSGGSFGGGSSFFITAPGVTGQLNFQNATVSTGIGVDVSTDALIKFRTRAQSADADVNALNYQFTGGIKNSTTLLTSSTAPTISSGFGASPAILSSNGATTFRINVGTGGVATSGVIALPTAATGWNCIAVDLTNNTVTRQTASTTATATLTAAAAWAASDTLVVQCFAF